MNKKIFTLLASALMLFSTALTVNAKIIGGNLAVGDTVRTLPKGDSKGMYHIRIDSIYDATGGIFQKVGGAGSTYAASFGLTSSLTGVNATDTFVVGVKENGVVVPVSMNHMRHTVYADTASYTDLQSVMWCTAVLEENSPLGQWPTFYFTNKALGQSLDFTKDHIFVGGVDKGWMFSFGFDKGQLSYSMPINRISDRAGYSIALVWDPVAGAIRSAEVRDDSLTAEIVPNLLKFTIVEVAPVVLDAKAFNTKLGVFSTADIAADSVTRLKFSPAPSNNTAYPNYFGEKLVAFDDADYDQYLNVRVGSKTGNYIYNVVNAGVVDEDRYTNGLGVEHIRILADGKYDALKDNNAYRFVYFPSTDSVVINALEVAHLNNSVYSDGLYEDAVAKGVGSYEIDGSGRPIYYGLYTEEIHDALIIRRQDLFVGDNSSLMIIGKHPANTRIHFGIDGCSEIEIDAWIPDEGIYTIWDDRGRCLGVRIYNGSLTPQWMELKDIEGECPDRIPSYQWVIEKAEGRNYNHRVNITNREFGNMDDLRVSITNVLIKTTRSQIFKGKGQFTYAPLATDVTLKYTPITTGWVIGRYLDVVDKADCVVENIPSGFRPVNNAYVADQYLGYKHFYVDTDPLSISFGKSEDVVGMGNITEKGMDYNAFAFNYYHGYDNEKYIDLTTSYDDTVLHVNPNGGKEGFQFMLGADLNKSSTFYATEKFGWPLAATDYFIDMKPQFNKVYEQNAPILERYYYELKVADFYGYRDGLREEFVIMKGFYHDGRDINNKLKYGVADTLAQVQPLKYANVYLRDTYFIPKTKKPNEERKYQDPSRRTYYTVMDRIEEAQLDRVTELGLQVSDTLKSLDESSKAYNLVIWGVDDEEGSIKAQGKTISSVRLSTFSLENMNYPLYRRLCSIEDDGAANNGDGSPMPYDAPKTLRFYEQLNNHEYLYEDARSGESANRGGINFLGLANIDQYSEDKVSADGLKKFNYNIFVDTAYINRGTGWIKPQYLLAVDVTQVAENTAVTGTNACGDVETKVVRPYIKGRYLVNATDSARFVGSNGAHANNVLDDRYITSTSWDRLIFVDAIHVDDRLYLLGMFNFNEEDYPYTITAKDGEVYYDADALYELTTVGGPLYGLARRPQHSYMLGAYYDFEEWQNYHNDVSFSLRFNNRNASNPSEFTGTGGAINDIKSFRIESETTQRNPYGNRKIAPVQGGWVKIDNGAAVLSRTAYKDAIEQSEIFNVEKGTGHATDNGTFDVPNIFTAVAGIGEVSILNANGKNLTITNMLGQSLVNKVLDSDNVTVNCSKGIVFVSVQGEKTVKSIVK